MLLANGRGCESEYLHFSLIVLYIDDFVCPLDIDECAANADGCEQVYAETLQDPIPAAVNLGTP